MHTPNPPSDFIKLAATHGRNAAGQLYIEAADDIEAQLLGI